MPVFGQVIATLDLASAIVFAITGALVASRKEMDVIGFIWLATVTGVGGGTLRDLLLGAPVFWVVDPLPVALCIAVAVVVHFTAHLVASRYRALLWFDAFGMALIAVVGAAKATDLGAGPLIAVVMGVITASFGGIVRDILGGEPSVILRREIYVTAAAIAAIAFLLAELAGAGRMPASVVGILAGFALRGAAIAFGWSMPVYRARPGRDPKDL